MSCFVSANPWSCQFPDKDQALKGLLFAAGPPFSTDPYTIIWVRLERYSSMCMMWQIATHAIEVDNKLEWSFGFCETGSGVFSCRRTENPMYIFRESLSLGHTELSPAKVREILIKLSQEWQGNSYDLLSRNCNHFCNDFCAELGVQKLPGWVNRFANAGETAFEVAETTMKRLRQAKTEVVSASKVAYRVLFGNASTSTVSPDPGQLEGSSSNGGVNVLRLPFLKTPVSLLSRIGIGSSSSSMNERLQVDESVNKGKGSVHVDDPNGHASFQEAESIDRGKGIVHVNSSGGHPPQHPPI
ncbi:hypothetical protein GOP47_0014237 [Adiantum capillus-veneris]|uniref:PPPDE domain-containing protein n=1 Tax=Adiantum capillus-veneris TaxID=13818 RepID=A0A9D4ZCA4_ADICA|nr:hypothetical protein GOP47_0014237 [Adiantum capillus-veneris]